MGLEAEGGDGDQNEEERSKCHILWKERYERKVKQEVKYRGFDSETSGRDKSCIKTKYNARPSSCGIKMPSLTCKDPLAFKLGGRAVYKYMLTSIPVQIALLCECKFM